MLTELKSQKGNLSSNEPKKESFSTLSMTGHLEELQKRLWIVIMTIAVTSVVGFYFSDRLVKWLKRPAGDTLPKLSFFSPAEAVIAYLKVALVFGVFVSLPVILYEVWAFIRPGLTLRERRYGLSFVFWGSLLFLAGAAFAYWILLPPSLAFLLSFGSRTLQPVISINHYLSFTSTVILACGVVFEFPIVIFFLTKLGLVTPQKLRGNWKMAFLGMVIVAAAVTPTQDPINLILMTVPLLLLYEISIVVSVFASRRRKDV